MSSDGKYEVILNLRISQFELPPVRDALAVGRKAIIGPHAIFKAMEEMTPGKFRLIRCDHESIEALIIRESDLRKLPQDRLVEAILAKVEPIQDPAETLHVRVDMEFATSSKIVVAPGSTDD